MHYFMFSLLAYEDRPIMAYITLKRNMRNVIEENIV